MKWSVKMMFTLSIFVNLLLVGVIGGHLARKAQHHTFWQEDNISVEARALLKEKMKGKFSEIKPLFQAMRDTKNDMEQILAAPEFDEAAFYIFAGRMSDLHVQITQKRLELTMEIVKELSPEDRKALASHLASKLTGRVGKGRYNKKDGHKEAGEAPE